MSTNATINVVNGAGNVDSIYLHWDGDSAGATLVEHYDTIEKATQLIKLGNLSSLGAEIGRKHDFDGPYIPEVCTAYGRDRGERSQQAERFDNKAEFLEDGDVQQYNYLFENGKWTVSEYDRGFNSL